MSLLKSRVAIKYLLVLSILTLTACAPVHYTRVQGNLVSLYLTREDAVEVLLFSSANGYRPLLASKIENDTWAVSVDYQDEFEYFYKVDGKVVVPDCELKVNDDFGSQNCVFLPGL